MPDIMHIVEIEAPPERVFEALTRVEDIRQWWTREADLDPRVDGSGELRFYDGRDVTQFQIKALERPLRLVWAITASNAPGGWGKTTITFGLERKGACTTLRFAHRGFAAESDGFALVSTGWAYYLVSLKKHVECGHGAPQQEKDFLKVLS